MPGNAMNPYIKIVLMLLIPTLMVYGCSSQQEKLVGKYTAVKSGSADSVTANLELKADGNGFWSIETDNASFRWDFYRDRIRLHTKSGGVVEGTMDNGTIQLTLPGMGLIRFKRIQ